MSKHFLHEDVDQIQKYFPGARTVALHTPFDLTQRPSTQTQTRVGITPDPFRDKEQGSEGWYGDLAWNR